jgi:alpha-L-fucosidase
VDLYYKSVGRNGVLLLNLPPDRRGLIHERDVQSLKQFKSAIDATFKENLALGKMATMTVVDTSFRYAVNEVTDGSTGTYWSPPLGARLGELIIDLGQSVSFDRIMLQEPIFLGQHIKQFTIYCKEAHEPWREIIAGTTIGYKRLLRFDKANARYIKIVIDAGEMRPALNEVGVYLSSTEETGLSD